MARPLLRSTAMISGARAAVGALTVLVFALVNTAWAWEPPAETTQTGGVSYIGEQRRMFETGRSDAAVNLRDFQGAANLYAIGPVSDLDGEITVFNSMPYISKVKDPSGNFLVDKTFNHGAIFLVWTQAREWRDAITVPDSVTDYKKLEEFVNASAVDGKINVSEPFPFLLEGKVRELDWHINVNRTGGKPVTRELFKQSKQPYKLQQKDVDIFGVYTEKHGGVFLGQGLKIHIHFVSDSTTATGHIDAINPAGLKLKFAR